MTTDHRDHLLAERTFLRREMLQVPNAAQLTRKSMEARLRKVEDELGMVNEAPEQRPESRWVDNR